MVVAKLNFTPPSTKPQSIVDGLDLNTRRISVGATGPNMYAGGGFGTSAVTTQWRVYTAVFNGAASALQVDTGTAVAGTVGASTSTGLSIGDCPNTSAPPCEQDLDGDVADVVIYSRALTSFEIGAVASFLRAKNGF
jgi:hypothetical protein